MSRSSERPTWDDIDLYLAGIADADIRARVNTYFSEHSNIETVIRKNLQPLADGWPTEEKLASLRESIVERGWYAPIDSEYSASASIFDRSFDSLEEYSREKSRSSSLPRFQIFRIGILGVGLSIMMGLGVWFGSDMNRAAAPSLEMTYKTHNAQQSTIVLGDGTRVVLNVNSALYLPEGFGNGMRTVRLEGEAFFDVTHHGKEPFVVETEQASTSVLGTEFGIRAYPGEEIRVAVRSGRIAVNRTVVGQEEVAVVDRIGLVTVARDDVEKILSFSNGKLILRDIPLRQALVDLERWYDVEIKLATPGLGDARINATLFTGTIEDLEEMLRLTFGVRVERRKRVVTVYVE